MANEINIMLYAFYAFYPFARFVVFDENAPYLMFLFLMFWICSFYYRREGHVSYLKWTRVVTFQFQSDYWFYWSTRDG